MKTIRERIIEKIIIQLEYINQSNGYEHEIGVGNIYRSVPIIEQNIVPAATIWELEERRQRNKYGGTVRTLLVRIECVVETNGDRHSAAEANALLGDLEKALMIGDTSLDELVEDIQDVAAEIIHLDLDSQLAAVSIDFEIRYITEWGNPYNSHS
jgi:hypothetical protein